MSDSVEYKVDHAKRRLIRRVKGDWPSSKVCDDFLRYYDQHPEVLAFDVITNYLEHTGRVDWEDIEKHARAVNARLAALPDYSSPVFRRAVVSDDPMAGMLLRATSRLFRQIESEVFRDEASAIAWLDQAKSEKRE